MYDAGTVVAIDLELPQEKKEELEDEPDEYVKGTFSLSKTNVTPGGPKTPVVTSLPVEVKLKGNVLGSFRTLDKKAAFKLKFGKKEPFLGLRKMTLNNMVEDYSSIHETLAYRVFRAAGIAAPRTGFAWVRLNGEDFGLYLNLENLDKVNLERWFGPFQEPPQHLYEGEDGTDVTPGVDALGPDKGGYEVDEGDKEHLDDLKALVTAVNSGTGAGWLGRVAPYADLVEMTRMWAVEKYIGHWDGYSGEEGPLKPNNYYLYSDGSGSFQMLPWGTDNTWEPFRRPSFDGDAGLLFDDCLTDPSCAPLYRQALRDLRGTIASLGLDSLAVQTAGLLEPWEQQEQTLKRHEHSISQIETGVSETRDFISNRPAELAAFLGPEEEPPHPKTVIDSFPPLPGLYVGHARRAGTAIVTHLWLPGPGVVTQAATMGRPKGARNACAVKASVGRSGSLNLRCSLTSLALFRLRSRAVGLRVQTSFVPRVGSRESRTRRITLARLDAR
jgi:CotH kinase protein